MRDFIIDFIAALFMYCAVGYNRSGKSRIILFSRDWWVVIILVTIGLIIHDYV